MSMVEVASSGTQDLVRAALDIASALPEPRPLWFRGHECPSHTLVSSLARRVSTPEELFEKERRLITRFRQRSLPFWPAGYPQNDWEQLFAMQHHGIPTRLLDWSENLFVALYFASRAHAHADEKSCNPIVWAIDPIGWNRDVPHLRGTSDEIGIMTTDSEDLDRYAPISPGSALPRRYVQPVSLYGTYNSARIVAQRGTFTVAGNSLEPLESFADGASAPNLWRVEITAPRAEIASDLSSLGFTESMIFPDLSGVSREIVALENI